MRLAYVDQVHVTNAEAHGQLALVYNLRDHAKQAEADLKRINELLETRVREALDERDKAEAALELALTNKGLKFRLQPGEGAFVRADRRFARIDPRETRLGHRRCRVAGADVATDLSFFPRFRGSQGAATLAQGCALRRAQIQRRDQGLSFDTPSAL